MEHTRRLLEAAGHRVVPFAVADERTAPTPWARWFPPGRPGGAAGVRAPGPVAGVYSWPARRRLERLLNARRFDVAHAHNVYEGLTLSVLDALVAAGIPTAITLHDYRAVCPNGVLRARDGLCRRCLDRGGFAPALRHRCVQGSLRLSAVAAAEAALNRRRRRYERAGVLIAPSRFMRDVMVSAGLPAGRIAVVPNPVPEAPAAPAPVPRASALAGPALAPTAPAPALAGPAPAPTATAPALAGPAPAPTAPARFLHAGRLTEDKGLRVLLAAAGRLGAAARVVVAGRGRLEEELRRRVAAERLPVDVLGFAPRDDIERELCAATAAVLPSLWYENCPMAILEAAARGVPSIASDLGGMAELIDHGREGMLVPPNDPAALAAAMLRLAGDPALARTLGARARERARNRHSEAGYLRALLDCYEQARSRGRAAARSHGGAANPRSRQVCSVRPP